MPDWIDPHWGFCITRCVNCDQKNHAASPKFQRLRKLTRPRKKVQLLACTTCDWARAIKACRVVLSIMMLERCLPAWVDSRCLGGRGRCLLCCVDVWSILGKDVKNAHTRMPEGLAEREGERMAEMAEPAAARLAVCRLRVLHPRHSAWCDAIPRRSISMT